MRRRGALSEASRHPPMRFMGAVPSRPLTDRYQTDPAHVLALIEGRAPRTH